MSDNEEARSRAAPPQLQCPRCAHPTTRASAPVCRNCGLREACATCGERFEDPLNAGFCATCGAAIEQPDWGPGEPAPAPHVDPSAAPSHRAHARPSVPAPVANLFAKAEPPAAISSLGERARRRGGRITARTVRRVFLNNLGGLYQQLGEALMERERFPEATDAYRHALEEAGDDHAWRRQIYASLAESTAGAAEHVPAMRADAVRTALEASLRAPDVLVLTVSRLRDVLDAETLSAHGGWIAGQWWPEAAEFATGAGRVDCAILAGRAALSVGDYATALNLFREARATHEGTARVIARRTLTGPLVPAALLEVAPAQAHWIQAQAREAAGDDEGALEEVELALGSGFGSDDTAHISARELHAALLERRGRAEEAAQALTSLARALTELAHHGQAIERLERAIVLAPTAPQPWWQLADTRRFEAQREDVPFVELAGLRRARSAALEGFARGAPKPWDVWAYCVLALIDDQLADLDELAGDFIADGLLAAEQALALDAAQADAWALSSRFCRELGFLEAAMRAAAHAVAADEESLLAAQEELTLHLMIDSVDAPAVLRRHKATLSGFDAALQVAAGYLHLLHGRWEEALRKLARAARSGADDPVVRFHRGLASELVSGPDSAAADFEWICRTLGETPGPYRREQAWSTALAGRPQDAARLFERPSAWLAVDESDRQAGLAACAALEGDPIAVESRLEKAIGAIRVRGDASTVALFATVLARRIERGALRDLLEAARERAEAAAQTAAPVHGELKRAIEEVDRAAGAAAQGTSMWLATRVLLARLAGESDDWARAVELYDELADAGEPERPFPESVELRAGALRRCSEQAQHRGDVDATEATQARLETLGLLAPWERDIAVARAHRAAGQHERAVARLASSLDVAPASPADEVEPVREAGDLLLDLGAREHAETAYLRAVAGAETATIALGQGQLRLGLLAALRDDVPEARQWLVLATDSVSRAAGDFAVGMIVDELDELVTEDERPRLNTALRALDQDPLVPRGRRWKLAAARFHGARRRQPAPRIEPVAAIAISVDTRLFPQGDRSPVAKRLLEDEFPALRQRVAERTGVRLPGFTLRAHAEPLGGGMDYTILVREIRLASGVLPEGSCLTREGARCRELGLDGQPLAIGKGIEDAMWLGEQEARVAREAGLQTLDHAAALAWHVELTVRPHLAQLVGVSEIDYEVDEWASQEDGARLELVERALPGRGSRVKFARLVHRLVEEQVPVDRLDRLLASFEEAREEGLDLSATVARVRRDLVVLPGSRFDRSPIELDTEVEREIERFVVPLGHTRVLAVPERDAEPLLARLDAVLGTIAPSTVALVVSQEDIRPFVQRLIDSSWPGIPVISRAELDVLTEWAEMPGPMVVS